MEEEATRLEEDPAQQGQPEQPLTRRVEIRPIHEHEVDQGQGEEDAGMGVPGPEELLFELGDQPPNSTVTMAKSVKAIIRELGLIGLPPYCDKLSRCRHSI